MNCEIEEIKSNKICVTITTWNILYQGFWEKSAKDTLVENMEWDERIKSITYKLISTNADVICLQEVLLSTFVTDFAELITKYEYDFLILKRKKNIKNHDMGNVTLWKSSLYDLTNSKMNSTGVHVMLKDKITTKTFCISNIHLRAGLKSQAEVRLSQLKSTVKIQNKMQNLPCIIIGDYNDDLKDSGLRDLLELSEYKCTLSNESCYVRYSGNLYCFDNISVRNAEVIKIEQIIINKTTNRKNIPILPNKENPSDHIMVTYDVNLF